MSGRVPTSLPTLVLAAVLCLCVGCAPERPTNVLLIVVDTLRADHLGLYGYSRPTSPHLDRRAGSGVVFERAFATSPWTVPSFASMLTGLPPSAHGAGFEIEPEAPLWDRTAIDGSAVGLAQRLKRRGFETVAFLSNAFLEPRFGLDKGFDAYNMYERKKGADHAIDAALNWLAGRGDRPFFMLLHFMEPHAPYAPPEPFRGRFTGETEFRKVLPLKERRKRAAEYTEDDRRYFAGRYDEEIAALDDRLERLFEGLGERWSDTLVVFVADHGEELLDHGGFDHGHTMMQELLHVPLVMWSPALSPRRVDAPVSVADLSPTILDALGLDASPPGVPGSGRSIWGLATGEEPGRQRALIAETTLYGAERKSVIRWPHKLVLEPATGWRRLVDLEKDPDELRDLAADRPELADELEGVLRRYMAAVGERRSERAGDIDSETARELEALGYVN